MQQEFEQEESKRKAKSAPTSKEPVEQCPICLSQIPKDIYNLHVNECLDDKSGSESEKTEKPSGTKTGLLGWFSGKKEDPKT